MWRQDATRGASSPQALGASLHLHWVREFGVPRPAWADQVKLQFDAVYEPVVVGDTVYLNTVQTDSVLALDVATGTERWRFQADGPVRFAPLVWEDAVYLVSDDGHLYCLHCKDGSLRWKFRGGPSQRLILGNERLISTWPARGAPVVADGTLYFAAGIWPFMGIFLHALDARTGTVIWTNDGDGSVYLKQPHNADSYAGVAPQGPLVVAGDELLVPGGRSVPAVYDRKTGKFLRYQLAENGKRGGGAEVVAAGAVFLNGGAAFERATETSVGDFGRLPVTDGQTLFAVTKDVCRSYDLLGATITTTDTVDRKGKKVRVPRWNVRETGSVSLSGVLALIRAGDRLYAGAKGRVWAVNLPLPAQGDGPIAWQTEVTGTPLSLVAAADRLFVSTQEGRLYCFGKKKIEPTHHPYRPISVGATEAVQARVQALLKLSGVREGYALVEGAREGKFLAELAAQSSLRIVAFVADPHRVHALRHELTAQGLYGDRVAVLPGSLEKSAVPPYLANLIVIEAMPQSREAAAAVFASLRPFGGIAVVQPEEAEREAVTRLLTQIQDSQAKVRTHEGAVLLIREGALPGSGNWTHEHADAANTRVSLDSRVKAPLGLLWFGGPSHDSILPRHGHGPQPQVIEGRLLIEGMDALRCTDVYTGRLLWEVALPGLGKFYNNLAHQPGANATGTNFISTADGIYVVHGKRCLKLDLATGKQLASFTLPLLPGQKESSLWGYVNVVEDTLIGGGDPLLDAKLFQPTLKGGDDPAPGSQPEKPKDSVDSLLTQLKLPRLDNDNLSSSKHLVVMDRQTGTVRWTATARLGFRHNAICVGGGKLFAIDRHSGPELARMKRRGQEPSHPPRLVVMDLASGRTLWQTEADVFGTWLSYSAKHDVVVEAGRVARDTLVDEAKGMRAYRAATGEILWNQPAYVGPAMLHGDIILKDRSACDLVTGEPVQRADPLTGEPLEWVWQRNYGCNTPMASQHLLTFRSGAAGFYDFAHDGGTANLGGFRSGCTNNLVVAGGVLVAPDYTRTCSCNYQNQTSLAFVHMPEAELWTFSGTRTVNGPVRRVGVNLGAPGSRKAEDGTLWLEYPKVGGPAPVLPVQVAPPNPTWFRRHASQVSGTPLPWVAASGGTGLTSVTVTLDTSGAPQRTYRVRLHFVEPEALGPGQRVFAVQLQGKTVLDPFDVAKEAGGTRHAVVKEFKSIEIVKDLIIGLKPIAGAGPVLCGIEVIAEGW